MEEWKVKRSILASSIEDRRLYRSRIKKFRKTHAQYVVLLIALLILQFIALAFFTKGFLLTRPVYDNVSYIPQGSTSKFNKTIMLIISDVGWENVIPIDKDEPVKNNYNFNNNNEYDNYKTSSSISNEYDLFNNLPVFFNEFNNSITDPYYNNSALLLKMKTYPPFNTLQRIKCLTAGSIPSYVDTGITFYGSIIEEDNLLKQLHLHDRKLDFTGNKYWNLLYNSYFNDFKQPENINDTFKFMNDHLLPKNKDQWDVLVGHILEDKLDRNDQQEINSFIENMIDKIDDDTLLVVFGDSIFDENNVMDSMLFIYCKEKNVFNLKNFDEYDISKRGQNYRFVDQFDLVPSLSFLNGLSIPFNSLGWPIDELMINDKEKFNWLNSTLYQLKKYKDTSNIKKSKSKSKRLDDLWDNVINDPIKNGHLYQNLLFTTCQKKWTQFEILSIIIGISFLSISLILLIFITKMIPSILVSQMVREFVHSIMKSILISNIILDPIFWFFNKPISHEYMIWFFLFATGTGIIIGCFIPIFNRYNWAWIYSRLFEHSYDYWTNIGMMFLIIHCSVFASNSYIVWEDRITSFLLTTFGVLTLYEFIFIPRRSKMSALLTAVISEQQGTSSGVNPSKANSNSLPPTRFARLLGGYHSIILIICTRISSSFTICRQEQGDKCIPNFTDKNNYSYLCLIICGIIIFFLPLCVKGYYNLTSSYQAAAPLWIDALLKGLLVGNFIYWSLEAMDFHGIEIPIDIIDMKLGKQAISRILTGFTIVICNLGWVLGPLCIKLNTTNSDMRSQQTTILGYSNIYGAPFFLLVINALMAIMLFSKPIAQISYSLMINQLLSILEIIDLLKLKENIVAPLSLGLLAYQQFFATGHQATVMSVQWDVAHILSDTATLPLTSLTLILNTFGPHILVALSVALITLWQQPPDVLKPVTLLGRIVSNCGTLLIYHTVQCLTSGLLVLYFQGHVLEWEVFCPRYFMAASSLIVIQVVVTFVTIAFACGRLITHINDIFWK